MPCLSLLAKGDELVGSKVFRLRRPIRVKFLKLLHAYTNIDSADFKSGSTGTRLQERLLFVRFNFINFDMYDNFTEGHSYISIGASKCGGKSMLVRDLYKVLIDKEGNVLQGDLKMEVLYLDSKGEMKPLTLEDVNHTHSSTKADLSFLNIVMEYEEI